MIPERRKENEEEENKFYSYSGIGFARKVQKLKKEYIPVYKSKTGEIQKGLKIHLEYHYLLNTDLNWIVRLIRESALEVIKEELLEYSENYPERIPKRPILTLNIEQVSTEKSIDLLFTLGIISPEIIEALKYIGINLISIWLYRTFEKLKNKNIRMKNRNNWKRLTSTKTKFIRHPDGTIEYIEEKDEFEFE